MRQKIKIERGGGLPVTRWKKGSHPWEVVYHYKTYYCTVHTGLYRVVLAYSLYAHSDGEILNDKTNISLSAPSLTSLYHLYPFCSSSLLYLLYSSTERRPPPASSYPR